MVSVISKANGKRLHPWEIANASFHAEEEVRAKYIELIHSAHRIPPENRKKWNGHDLYEPGEIFDMPIEEGQEKTPHVYMEPVIDVSGHFEVLDRKTNRLHKLTAAIPVRKKPEPFLSGT